MGNVATYISPLTGLGSVLNFNAFAATVQGHGMSSFLVIALSLSVVHQHGEQPVAELGVCIAPLLIHPPIHLPHHQLLHQAPESLVLQNLLKNLLVLIHAVE